MIQTNFVPLKGKVILNWAKDAQSTTESGIILTEAIKRNDVATIIAVPNGSDFEVGQKVIFNKLGGTFVRDKLDQEVLIISEEDIWAVVDFD